MMLITVSRNLSYFVIVPLLDLLCLLTDEIVKTSADLIKCLLCKVLVNYDFMRGNMGIEIYFFNVKVIRSFRELVVVFFLSRFNVLQTVIVYYYGMV